MSALFSDTLRLVPGKTPEVLPEVHHLPGLLAMQPEEILHSFRRSQKQEFTLFLQKAELDRNLFVDQAKLLPLFEELHDFVMEHPVWRHPFFIRFFHADFDSGQLEAFALHYFNQIKNTRQCVALALGRFASTADFGPGNQGQKISEMTQLVLAQLLADEYGVGNATVDHYPKLGEIFDSMTHIRLYRQLLGGLQIAPENQDIALLPAVADNVLIQRILAADPAFSPLEALASVGLGMEWGVPEFFSLLLGGLLRYSHRQKIPLTRHHLQVFTDHIRYDVMHAVSVLAVTSLQIKEQAAIEQVKNATAILMSGRYAMMSGIYEQVFAQPCPAVPENLPERYHIRDRRIEQSLARERSLFPASQLADTGKNIRQIPFIFA